jgi:hypothetical protein
MIVNARESCAAFLRELQDEWPQGRMPTDTASIERKVGWFYDHHFHGISKSTLATDFADHYQNHTAEQRIAFIDGRRKDVRGGIRDAESWLGSSGAAFSRPPG